MVKLKKTSCSDLVFWNRMISKMAHVQTEEKTLLKHLVSGSAISAVSKSPGCESGCWPDPGNFLLCRWSRSWSAEAQSIYCCTKCPASLCCTVTRGCCARPFATECFGAQVRPESEVMGKECRRGACSGLSLGLYLSLINSAIISEYHQSFIELPGSERTWQVALPQKDVLASLFD